jgi:4-amino-4-deoxy-L-arabinose transferase-like glycosyltransferase
MSEATARAALPRAGRYVSRAWWAERLQQGWARPELRWLAAILILAAVLRIVWVLYAAREPQGLHDQLLYILSAGQIADGNGYQFPDAGSTAYYPVGYPAALGGVFFLVKHTPIPDNFILAGAFFNVFLGVATVALVYQVGRRLFGTAVGLLAALWLAVFPNLVFHTATFLTEMLFNFLVMAALVVLLSANWREERVGWGRLLIFGALLGLSALVRPISLLFLPLLLIVWLVAGFGWRRSLGYTAAVLAVTVAVIAPWTVRNIVVMDAPIVISANVGDNLCIGHHPGAPGHFTFADLGGADYCNFSLEGYRGLDRAEMEVRRNNDNIRAAVKFALENPRFELKLLSRKAWYLWNKDHNGLRAVESYGDDVFIDPDLREVLMRVADIFFFVTISLGGLGLVAFVLPPRDPRRLFFLLALLALAGVPLVFFSAARFHVPVMPLLAVSAAWAVVSLRELPRLLAPPPAAAVAPGTQGPQSGPEEVAESGTSVAEDDAP